MSNFFDTLLARSREPVRSVRPRALSRFETQGKNLSVSTDEPLEQEVEEEVQPQRRPRTQLRQSFAPPAVEDRAEPLIEKPRPAPASVPQGAVPVSQHRAEPAVEQKEPLRADYQVPDVLPNVVLPSRERHDPPSNGVREMVREHETTFGHKVFSERVLNETEMRHSIVETALPGRVQQMLVPATSVDMRPETTRPVPGTPTREAEEPVIHVSIGRIEVRAISEPAPRRKERQPSGVMSLDEYPAVAPKRRCAMSNSLSIAAVTATLQQILTAGVTADPDLNDTTVTLLPLGKARANNTNNQLNLFLYQILRSAGWSNSDMPRQAQPGETSMPPLPLNLWYLLTAFGRDNDVTQPFGHQLLGKAMSVLYDHSVLSSDDIRNATAVSLPRSDLDKQLERVRITLQPLSIDEISKLWTGFATQYRLSAAYEISVALIESTRPTKTPVPVLTRGKSDSGISSQPDLRSPFPNLTSIVIPKQNPSALLGDTIWLLGDRLDGTNVGVIFNHVLWSSPIEIAIPAGPDATERQVNVTLTNAPALWPAGFYSVQVAVQRPGDTYRRTTNQLTLALAPSISMSPASAPAASNITYTATVAPEVRPEQRAALLLGSAEILADPHATQTATLTFQSGPITAGDYFVRLRVDGVDSLLVGRTVKPPVFAPGQKVTVT